MGHSLYRGWLSENNRVQAQQGDEAVRTELKGKYSEISSLNANRCSVWPLFNSIPVRLPSFAAVGTNTSTSTTMSPAAESLDWRAIITEPTLQPSTTLSRFFSAQAMSISEYGTMRARKSWQVSTIKTVLLVQSSIPIKIWLFPETSIQTSCCGALTNWQRRF